MPITGGALWAGSVTAAALILAATREEAILGGPEYIRDADPEGITKRIGLALARQTCRRYADGVADISPARAVQYENACRPYLDLVGYGTGAEAEIPFDGGQCDDGYLVTWFADNDDGTTSGATVLARGPITSIRRRIDGNQFFNELGCSGLNASSSICGPISSTGAGFYGLSGGTSVTPGGSIRIIGISPCGSDNCGNPPPVIKQPEPPVNPGPVFEPVIIIPIVDIDAGVVVNIDGTVDITIDGVEITINPFEDPTPSGGGGGELPPGDIGTSGPGGVATGGGNAAEGEAPEGSVLVGLKCVLTTIPISAREYAPGVYRAVAYVYMGVTGNLDHDPAGSMMTANQFVFAEKDNLTSWRVVGNLGYVIAVTPYYREITQP